MIAGVTSMGGNIMSANGCYFASIGFNGGQSTYTRIHRRMAVAADLPEVAFFLGSARSYRGPPEIASLSARLLRPDHSVVDDTLLVRDAVPGTIQINPDAPDRFIEFRANDWVEKLGGFEFRAAEPKAGDLRFLSLVEVTDRLRELLAGSRFVV